MTMHRNLREKAKRRGWILSKDRAGRYTLVAAYDQTVTKSGATAEEVDALLARCCPYEVKIFNQLIDAATTAVALEKLGLDRV